MKRALVTGASEGIGREFALQLAERGFAITGVARNEARLAELLAELGGNGHHSLVCDLSEASGIAAVTRELDQHHYDLVVNNAGIGVYGRFGDIAYPEIETVMRVNVEALVAISHAYLRTARQGDALLNLSSTLAFLPAPWAAVYSATKAFVTTFSEALYEQYRKDGVFVMNVCPGATTSKFHERAGGTVKRRPPAEIFESAEAVVGFTLEKLALRRDPTVVSGRKNRLAVAVTRLLPRKRIVAIMAKAD